MKKYRVISLITTKNEKYLIREVEAKNKKEAKKIFESFEPIDEENHNEETSEKILDIDEI